MAARYRFFFLVAMIAMVTSSWWNPTLIDSMIVVGFFIAVVWPGGLYLYRFFRGIRIHPSDDLVVAYFSSPRNRIQSAVVVDVDRQVGMARFAGTVEIGGETLPFEIPISDQSKGRVTIAADSPRAIDPVPNECVVTVRVIPEDWFRAVRRKRTYTATVRPH